MGFFKLAKNSKAPRMLAAMATALLMGQAAMALPDGATVQHGGATINVGGQQMTIQQTTQQAIINWNGFNISAGELVNFLQPSQLASVLNRVTGVDPSVINGILQGNGNIFLINPNGVLIGPGGMVNAGGFLASTLDLSNEDFLSGNMHFTQTSGRDFAAVVNQGEIKVTDGGFVMLLAPSVGNEGLILAKNGSVTLGAGKEATVNFDGRNLVNFALAKGPIGSDGTLVMSQTNANSVLAQVVNNLDIEEAGSLTMAGHIEGGTVNAQAAGDVVATDNTVVGQDIVFNNIGGNLDMGTQVTYDGGSIRADVDGNITFNTLIAEPRNNQGGVVDLTARGSGGISGQAQGQGIAADLVQLSTPNGSVSARVAANTLTATAPNGDVSLSLTPGVIDGNASSSSQGNTGTQGNTSTGSSTSSTNISETNSSGGSSSSGLPSAAPTGLSENRSSSSSSSSSNPLSGSGGVPGLISRGSSSSSSTPSTDSTSTSSSSPGLRGTLAQTTVTTDGVGTLVGSNGTKVRVTAGGNVVVDSVNTVIIDQISGRNVTVNSQTGSVIDDGSDQVGRGNLDIIASQNANLTAADFIGTVDDPLEVQIGGDLNVFARNEIDGISGVILGRVGGRYIQNDETAGIVLLNPGANSQDGLAQAQRNVLENQLPGDHTIGGASTPNLFLLRLVNAVDEAEWLEILRGTVVWEDSDEEATEQDL